MKSIPDWPGHQTTVSTGPRLSKIGLSVHVIYSTLVVSLTLMCGMPKALLATSRHHDGSVQSYQPDRKLLQQPENCLLLDQSESEGLWLLYCPQLHQAAIVCQPSGARTTCQGIRLAQAPKAEEAPTLDAFLHAYWPIDPQTVQQLIIAIGTLQADPQPTVQQLAFNLLHSLRGGLLLQRIANQWQTQSPALLRRLICTLWLIFPEPIRQQPDGASRLHEQGVLCARALWQPDTLPFRLRQLAQPQATIERVGTLIQPIDSAQFDTNLFVCPTPEVCLRSFSPQSPPWNLAIVDPNACVADILGAHISQTVGHSNPEKIRGEPDPVQSICDIPSLSRLRNLSERYKSIAQQNIVGYETIQQKAPPRWTEQPPWQFLNVPKNSTQFPKLAVQLPFAILKSDLWKPATLQQSLQDYPDPHPSKEFSKALQQVAITVAWALGLSDSQQETFFPRNCGTPPVATPFVHEPPDCLWPFPPLPMSIPLAPAPAPTIDLCDEACEIEILQETAPPPR